MIHVMVQPGWRAAAHQQPARPETNNAPPYMPAAATAADARSCHVMLVQVSCRPRPLQRLQTGQAVACHTFRQQHVRHAQCITAGTQSYKDLACGPGSKRCPEQQIPPSRSQPHGSAKNDAAVREPMRLVQGAQRASPACATPHKRNRTSEAPIVRSFAPTWSHWLTRRQAAGSKHSGAASTAPGRLAPQQPPLQILP
jgi:hypothetical protein